MHSSIINEYLISLAFNCIFLLGDAAHLTPPFAGQGMNSGIRDATNLCWKLSYVINNIINPNILNTYELERKPHAKALIEQAVVMGKIMSPTNYYTNKLRYITSS